MNSLKITSNLSYARVKARSIEANSSYYSPLGSALALSPILTPYAEGDAADAQLKNMKVIQTIPRFIVQMGGFIRSLVVI